MKPHYLISLVSLTLVVFGCSPSEPESEGAAGARDVQSGKASRVCQRSHWVH